MIDRSKGGAQSRHYACMPFHRFWFEFEDSGEGCRLPFGCGVTAPDEAAALQLVADTYCDGRLPTVRKVVADVDVGELAEWLERSVRPLQLGFPMVPGIWYPNLTGP